MKKIQEMIKTSPIPLIMGILNITPDSFSDGGEFIEVDKAFRKAQNMIEQGCAIIDVGPESTRPGSEPVSSQIQIERAIPVIEKIKREFDIAVSIDTCNADVARAALDAGVDIINDISAGSDSDMFTVAAEKKVNIILMHMQGMPKNMQVKPEYDDVVGEVRQYLLERKDLAIKAGVCEDSIILDPGIGFGKTLEHNISLTRGLKSLVETGFPILYAASRKSFIGLITGKDIPQERLGGTIASTIYAAQLGVSIIRVHDVAENIDALRMYAAINKS